MKREKFYSIQAADLVALIYALNKGAEEFGHLDADHTLEDLNKRLGFTLRVPKPVLESALFCCNLLDEENKFWHPISNDFNRFLKRVTGGAKFNKTYNLIEEEV